MKAPILREELFRWFCQIRGAVKGRLPLKILEAKAIRLRLACIEAAVSRGFPADVPKIVGTNWLWRFRKTYNISLRKPNKRWKVPRKVLLSRLRNMWQNTIRVRCLAALTFEYDMDADGFDQKPFHINEAGSKCASTLTHKGELEIPLKEQHSETRERWTVNTMVTSREASARIGPPLDVLFKGGDLIGARLEAALPALALAGLTSQTSDSGSYRLEHVLWWMDKALQRLEGDDGRWRLLFCDAYRAHEDDAVLRLAWKHRYVVIMHGGGTTGVAQVNDTHLITWSALEGIPGAGDAGSLRAAVAKPTRMRVTCVRDLVMIWKRSSIHLRSRQGFWSNQLLNAFDGSEDHHASSEIAAFWKELDMDKCRDHVIDEVCEEFEHARTEWSFEYVYSLIEPFDRVGYMDFYEEGQEDEGDDDNPGEVWDDRDNPSHGGSDDDDAPADRACEATELGSEQQAEVVRHAARLAMLDRAQDSLEGADAVTVSQLSKAIAAMRLQIVREASGRSQTDSKVARAVRNSEEYRRDMCTALRRDEQARQDTVAAEEKAYQTALRALDDRGKELAQQEQAIVDSRARDAERMELRERRTEIANACQGFTLGDLGQGQPGGGGERMRKNRMDLLLSICRLGDERPPEFVRNWERWSRRYDAEGVRRFSRAWAAKFRNDMADILPRITTGGDKRAFLRYVVLMNRSWDLEAQQLLVPSVVGDPV